MASKTPTLAELRKLAKRKGLWISVIVALYGPVTPVTRSALHAALSALPDKERAR